MREFESKRFDVVTCFMALMDIELYEDAISEVARVLRKNGRFVFSITHPCFEFGVTVDGEPTAKWTYEEGTENAAEEKDLYLEIKRHFGIVKYEVTWDMKRLVGPFQTTSFHRTLTDYFQALYKNGFVVTRLNEPKPTSKGVSANPSLRKHALIPHSVIIEAIRR